MSTKMILKPYTSKRPLGGTARSHGCVQPPNEVVLVKRLEKAEVPAVPSLL